MHELLYAGLAELRSAWRFRWYGAAATWTIALLGWGWVAWQPDIYEASARVYVDTSSVLRPLLNSRIVEPDVATRLQYIRQALLGRDYLESVAVDNDLDSGVLTTPQREAMLAGLANTISIDATPASRNNGRDDSSSIFVIRFRNERPETAVGVVTSLLNLLIEDTLGASRQNTDTVERFLDERIHEYENRLQEAEQALADFQKEHSERLPGTEGSYFQRIQREREVLAEKQRELRLAQSKRAGLIEQLNSETPVLPIDSGGTREPPPNSLDARIRDYRTQLDSLLLQYTEKHPDVIAVREALDRLEAQRAEQLRALGVDNPNSEISDLETNPIYQAVRIDLNQVEVEIATLEADVKDRQTRLSELQALIDEVPEVEAELSRLNRDYDVIRDQYQALIQSRETQLLSRKASDSDQVDFRVLNPPRATSQPVAPRRLMLLTAVLAAAFGAGGALCYLLAQIKPVFSSGAALRETLGLPVLGTVSRISISRKAKLARRFALVSFAGAMMILVAIFGAVVLVEIAGPGLHSVFELT